jgi:hypothetical protein
MLGCCGVRYALLVLPAGGPRATDVPADDAMSPARFEIGGAQASGRFIEVFREIYAGR